MEHNIIYTVSALKIKAKPNTQTSEIKGFNIYSELNPGEVLNYIKYADKYKALDAMSRPQSHVLLVESVDSIDHLLYELHLGVSQPVLVGDVVSHT